MSETLSGAVPPDLSVSASPGPFDRIYSACISGWTAIRRNWLVSVLLFFGFLLRLAAMLAYYPSLLYIDSYDYIVRAYTLDPQGNDPVGYSVFLRVVLKFSNLSTVVAIQHLFGLGMAVAIYALLRRYGIRRWLCALAVAPVLLDAYQVQIEQNILSDTLYETLIVAGIVLLAWHRKPPMWVYPFGGLLLGATVPVRTIGEVLFVAAVAFPLVVARGWWRKGLAVFFTVVGFAAPIIGYADYYYSVTGVVGISGQAYNNLYGRAAMVADCNRLPLTPQERVLCPTQPLGDRIGIDYYINAPGGPLMQQEYRLVYGEPHIDIPQATSGFVDEVLDHQFGAFARGVLDDFMHSFSPQSHVSAADVPASRWQFQTVYPIYPPGFTLQTADVVDALGGQGPIHMDVALAGDLRSYQLNGGSTPGPLLGAFTLVGVVCCCAWSKRVKASGLRPICLLVTLAGLLPLAVSDLFEYTVRYQLPATVILPAAGVIGLSALLHRPQEEQIQTAKVIYAGVVRDWRAIPAAVAAGDDGGGGAEEGEGAEAGEETAREAKEETGAGVEVDVGAEAGGGEGKGVAANGRVARSASVQASVPAAAAWISPGGEAVAGVVGAVNGDSASSESESESESAAVSASVSAAAAGLTTTTREDHAPNATHADP